MNNYFEPGQEIETTIVQISGDTIFLDLNAKTEGTLDSAELTDKEGNITVKEGDKIKAFFLTNRSGVPHFTTKIAGQNADADMLEKAFQAAIPVHVCMFLTYNDPPVVVLTSSILQQEGALFHCLFFC